MTLHGPPVADDQHGVPRVPEVVLPNLHPRFVPNAFSVSLDLHARQTGVATTDTENVTIGSSLLTIAL